jgi:hypothetical protein
MTDNKPKISRRRFLKVACVAGAVTIPAVLGYGLLHEARGEVPPSGSPYALVDMLETWPADPTAASPLLLLVNELADNPFGLYLAEILRAEGLNCFQVAHLSALGGAPLDGYDLVLLAEGPLNQQQAELLEGYVATGGRLVAMRPNGRLAHLFGVERQAGSLTEGYLQVDARHPIAQGIATETLQFHGTADLYRLAGAQAVAWLAGADDVPTGLPAVTLHRYGQGQAALWAFDLARSVAYIRQGNPEWADQERDGLPGVRVTDLLSGWIDLDRLPVPQADEQQRLLANLLSALSQDARPLPRLWYFPGAAESLLVATGDSHGNPASAIEDILTRVEQRGGHMSIYYTAYPSSDLRRAVKGAMLPLSRLPVAGDAIARQFSMPTPSQVADWRLRGHEFALHPYVEEGLDIGWLRHWEEFTGLGYGPVPPTTRTHRVLWQGWVETARTQAAYGIRLNLDSYHLGPFFRNEAGEWTYGYFSGSSLPMRFVDEQGRILNIYQQPTLLADEHLLSLPWVTGDVPGLPSDEAIRVSETLLRRSVDGAYGAITAQFHVDPFALGGQAGADEAHWLEGTLDAAKALGIPIMSALEWLHFTETRHDANLVNIQWLLDRGRLSFELVAQEVPDQELTVMLPLRHQNAELLQVDVDGLAVQHRTRTIGGVDYGWWPSPAGNHAVLATYGRR